VGIHYCIRIVLQVASGDPMVMWLSGLHAPESFLTALVQIACRKNGWPLERSASYTRVTTYLDVDDVDKWPDQVRIYILLLLVLHTISTALEIGFSLKLISETAFVYYAYSARLVTTCRKRRQAAMSCCEASLWQRCSCLCAGASRLFQN